MKQKVVKILSREVDRIYDVSTLNKAKAREEGKEIPDPIPLDDLERLQIIMRTRAILDQKIKTPEPSKEPKKLDKSERMTLFNMVKENNKQG